MKKPLLFHGLILVWCLIAFPALAGNATQSADADQDEAEISAPHVWWNEPAMIKEFALNATQRQDMDKALLEHMGRRKEQFVAMKEPRRALEEALRKNDFDAASAAVDGIVEGTSQLVRQELELKLKVFQGLSPEQLGRLLDDRPDLPRRSWLRAMRMQQGAGRNRAKSE